MNKTELLALAKKLRALALWSGDGSAADAADLCEQLAALEPVSWLSIDCIGERYLCFTKPNDLDPVEPLFNLTGIIDHEA